MRQVLGVSRSVQVSGSLAAFAAPVIRDLRHTTEGPPSSSARPPTALWGPVSSSVNWVQN